MLSARKQACKIRSQTAVSWTELGQLQEYRGGSYYLCPEEGGYKRLPRGADGKSGSHRRTVSYQREGGGEAGVQ